MKLLLSGLFFVLVWLTYLLLRKCSFNTRYKVICLIAFLIYQFHRKGRAKIKKNISLIRPDLDKKQIAKGSWLAVKTIANSWADMLGNEFADLEEIAMEIEVKGIEPLLRHYRSGKKTIIVVDHVGLLERVFGIAPHFGLLAYIPVEPVKPTWFFKFMLRLRLYFDGIDFEPVEKGQTFMRAAKQLSKGKIVVLAIDITSSGDSGAICRIGRGQARFPVGAVKLSLEQDATIFPLFPSKGLNGKIQVVVGPPFELVRTGNMKEDIENNTRSLIEDVYAPHIQENWDSWLRTLWIDLKPVKETNQQGC